MKTDAEIREMIETAKKATPGPWTYYESLSGCVVYPHKYMRTRGTELIERGNSLCSVDRSVFNTPKFIAMANPQTVIEMCEELLRLREENDQIKGLIEAREST